MSLPWPDWSEAEWRRRLKKRVKVEDLPVDKSLVTKQRLEQGRSPGPHGITHAQPLPKRRS